MSSVASPHTRATGGPVGVVCLPKPNHLMSTPANLRRRLALSVRQPFAELIIAGRKPIEFRSRPTHVCGRIYIYASLTRWPAADEAAWAEEFGLDVDRLCRGAIIGSVELFGSSCDDDGVYAWDLRNPRRFAKPRKPSRMPMPVWFRPWN